MKYLYGLLIIVACGLAYIRFEQPQDWNTYLDDLKVVVSPTEKSATGAVPSANASTANKALANTPTNPEPVTTAEFISPNSAKFTNPDHVRQVEQPAQPNSNTSTGFVINTNVAARSSKEFVPPYPIPAQPNWTWIVLYRVYHNVVVTKVEADTISITYDGGVGSVNQSDLTPELQKMFNYDTQAAALASHQKTAALAQAEAAETPAIAALQQKEKAQADADEAQRKLSIRNDIAAGNAYVAQDQIRQIQQDMQDMVTAHEVTVNVDPKTGAVTYGGTSYWLNKYYADQSAIAQWQHH